MVRVWIKEHVVWAVSLAIFLLSTFCAGGRPISGLDSTKDAFPGWNGEVIGDVNNVSASTGKTPWLEVVSWSPRAVVYHNFLTDEEADHLKALAQASLERSTVVGADGSVVSSYRTSTGTFLPRRADSVVSSIEDRIAAWTMLPVSHQEDLQVLKYEEGQEYKVHSDVISVSEEDGVMRCATVLMYLTEPEEGGETVFPNGEWVDPAVGELHSEAGLSECAQQGVAVKPKKGDALLFWSLSPGGVEDRAAMHAGCPVLKGEKYSATVWIHVKPFRQGLLSPISGGQEGCVDHNDNCGQWAENGECEKNPEYMVGRSGFPGYCMKSCGVCPPS